MKNSPLILALDSTNIEEIDRLILDTQEYVGVFKLGLEFFTAYGVNGVSRIADRFEGIEIFLDLKLHDIPNTVSKAAKNLNDLNPLFLTVHASGGAKMIAAAANELPDTHITAVTVLTSLDNVELQSMGHVLSSTEMAVNLARIAEAAGARAIVSSPLEVSEIRKVVNPDTKIITREFGFHRGEMIKLELLAPEKL